MRELFFVDSREAGTPEKQQENSTGTRAGWLREVKQQQNFYCSGG